MKPPETLARTLLAVLMLVAPLVFGARMLFGERVDEPQFLRPADGDFVLVTVGQWDDPAELPTAAHFAAFVRRGQVVGPLWASSDLPAAAAASLWTGRAPISHGVRGPSDRLPAGTWTVAEAARASGTRTAAFIGGTLVRDAGLTGFDQIIEDPAMDGQTLGRLARGFLARETDRRILLWLHLPESGPLAADFAALLADLDEALVESGRAADTIVFATALLSGLDTPDESRLLVPLIARLPAALNAGRTSTAVLAHTDIAGLAMRLLRLAPPSALAGQPPLQSRETVLWGALRGSSGVLENWMEGSFGEVLRLPDQRLALDPTGAFSAKTLRNPRAPEGATPLRGAALENARRRFADYRAALAPIR